MTPPSEASASMTSHVSYQGFVPLPVEEGDLVLIHGQVDHLSMPNTSDHSRHSFQLHLGVPRLAGATTPHFAHSHLIVSLHFQIAGIS